MTSCGFGMPCGIPVPRLPFICLNAKSKVLFYDILAFSGNSAMLVNGASRWDRLGYMSL